MGGTCSQPLATSSIRRLARSLSGGIVADKTNKDDDASRAAVSPDTTFVGETRQIAAKDKKVVDDAEITVVFLQEFFDPSEMRPWPSARFKAVNKVEDARRNHGQVHLMWDQQEKRHVAVKQMPNTWMGRSHSDFMTTHPDETEFPWQDIGIIKFLNSRSFPFACILYGVYQDDERTSVVTSFGTKGDLFSWCGSPVSQGLRAGPEREAYLKPLVVQLFNSVRQLHEMSIVHRDISMENFVISQADDGGPMDLKIIDFGMASTVRHLRKCVRGKSMYIAPELHDSSLNDFFLSDAFAVGVTVYAVLLQEYPWNFTSPGACKRFEYVQKNGFREYSRKRKVRNTNGFLCDILSEDLLRLLEGLLEPDPSKRLTLGETTWNSDRVRSKRRSVWDEAWTRDDRATVPAS